MFLSSCLSNIGYVIFLKIEKRGESRHFIFKLWHRLDINDNQPRTDWKFMTSSGDQIVIATPSEIYIFIFTFAFFWGFDYLEERPGVGKKRGGELYELI